VDQKITRTEDKKVEKYQELALEIRRIHRASKATIIPIVIGALGSISKSASLEVCNYRPFLELLTCRGKCCVSKLQWKNWRDVNMIIVGVLLLSACPLRYDH